MNSDCKWVQNFFLEVENVIRLDYVDGYTTLNILKKIELYILNMSCMICELYLNSVVKKKQTNMALNRNLSQSLHREGMAELHLKKWGEIRLTN